VELGPEEWFESPALVMIEWADRVVDLLPADRLEVEIEATGPETRVFRVVALGDESLRSLDCLIGRLDA
ncbi:MAG: tRNA (adenosine(37)-N6)-threonylcarbamoyltransferase complex ATPase subunit type 1 TsaE, partial [Planctomycetota bacterium]